MVYHTIVLIGESRTTYLPYLQNKYQTLVARSGRQGLSLAQEHLAQLIVIDALSLKSNGDRICRTLRRELPEIQIIHIHPDAAAGQSCADVVLLPPTTARKLNSAIKRVLNSKSPDMDSVVQCGPFILYCDSRILMLDGMEISLTPKQAALLEIFLRQPGQTFERPWLMKKVWQTDYFGDTRTLDVHIRMLRRVLEGGANHPRYLKTVRGVGYRLDIGE